ncbi:MAG: type IV toxin-antitoxin system AbiEi family antitoxin domain-containing protein [Acidobacteriota bacterium]|nr:type IV toxin-antitoxin system AbiEi family antitoxin domain-containing protein [Acidobacteriota bacterium]
MNLSERLLEIAGEKKLIKPKDLTAEKIPTVYLSRLVKQGKLLQVGKGLYSLPDTLLDENQSLLEVQHLVPKGVFCLLSALQFHNLTTQNPFQVWLAVDRNAAVPRIRSIQNRIFRVSGEMFSAGIEEHQVEGGTIRVYSPAKTVADCFKYRNKVGLDVAMEALKDAWRKRLITMDELFRFAKLNRVTNVLLPYAQMLVSD